MIFIPSDPHELLVMNEVSEDKKISSFQHCGQHE